MTCSEKKQYAFEDIPLPSVPTLSQREHSSPDGAKAITHGAGTFILQALGPSPINKVEHTNVQLGWNGWSICNTISQRLTHLSSWTFAGPQEAHHEIHGGHMFRTWKGKQGARA